MKASLHISAVTFNVAKANPARSHGIMRQLVSLCKKKKQSIIFLQEMRRWAKTLQGKFLDGHFLFCSTESDCGILLPASLVSCVKGIKSGTRHFMIFCQQFTLCSAHLMWQVEDNDELQAFHTMQDISNSIDLNINNFSSSAPWL